jgi:hypothetical protein
MSLNLLSNELILNLAEASRPDGFESLVLTSRRFYQVVANNPSILRSHNQLKKTASRLVITSKCSSDASSTYVFKALRELSGQRSLFREYIKTLEITPGGSPPWLDLGESQVLECQRPSGKNDDAEVLDKGARVLQKDEPEFEEYQLFRESWKNYGDADDIAKLDSLRQVWPAFATALSAYSCEDESTETFDNPDSAMILLVLSSPNLERLIINDEQGRFTAALSGIFRTIGKDLTAQSTTGESRIETTSPMSGFLRNLKILQFNHHIGFFPLQLVAPILSCVPLQELRMEEVTDMWTHSEFPACHFTRFRWLTPNPLMTISKLVIRTLDTKKSSLNAFLSKATNLRSLWLGFGSWTGWRSCADDPAELIQTIGDAVGPGLNNLMLTYRCRRDGREVSKGLPTDFRAFSKLSRLGLHARIWEDGEEDGPHVDFSVGEDGEYDFLPPTLKSLYLFKLGLLKDDSYNKILEAILQTLKTATALEEVIIVSEMCELPACVAKLRAQFAALGVSVSARKMDADTKPVDDIAGEYLEFFEDEGT